MLKIFENFLHVFGKMTSYGKIFKILFKSFHIDTPIDVLCSNFVKFGRREISEIVRCLPDKSKVCLTLQLLLLRTWCLKSASFILQQCNQECSRFHPNLFIFRGVIAERVPKRAVK